MPDAHRVRRILVDNRRISELRAYFDGMAAVADMIALDGEDASEQWGVALVSDNTGHYPLLLDYAATVQRSGLMRCTVHKTLKDAVAWLGLPPAVADKVAQLESANDSPGRAQSIDGTT